VNVARRHSSNRLYKFAAVGFVAAVLGIGLSYAPPASAAVTNTLLNDGQPIYLGIGHHNTFDGTSLTAGAYYDNYSNTSDKILIYGLSQAINSGEGCSDDNSIGGTIVVRPDQTYATVTLTTFNYTSGGAPVTRDSVQYNIRQDRFCNGGGTGYDNTIANRTGAYFNGRYQLPANGGQVDPSTGKYKVRIEIRFTSRTTSQLSGNGFYGPNAYFRLRAVTSTGTGSPRGLVAVDSGERVNTRVYTNTRGFYTHQIDYGTPCDISSAVRRTVQVSDPDNYAPDGTSISGTQNYDRPFGVYILEDRNNNGNYQPLALSRYSFSPSEARAAFDGTRYRIIPTTPQNSAGRSAPVNIETTMYPNAKYRFVARDVYLQNFLQIRLPSDGIYNAIDCDVVLPPPDLTPSVRITPNTSPIQVGSPFDVDYEIANGGSADTRVTYQARVFVDENNNGRYDSGDRSIDYNSASNTPISGNGSVTPPQYSETSALLSTYRNSGRVCGSLLARVNPPNRGTVNGSNEDTVVTCITLGKTPKIHIENGDITVGGGDTSNSCAVRTDRSLLQGIDDSTSNFGYARSEFGVTSMGGVRGFGSSNASFGGSQAAIGRSLTFGNESTPGFFRGTATPPATVSYCMNNPFEYLIDDATAYNSSTLSGRTLSGGQRQILNAGSRDVRITGNIRYPASTTSADDLAQFAILTTGSIYISENVTRLDGIYAAGGGVYTCVGSSLANTRLAFDRCEDQLTINGTVYAGSNSGVVTWRTYGAGGADRLEAAEVFNLSPAMLIPEQKAARDNLLETVLLEELPPRF